VMGNLGPRDQDNDPSLAPEASTGRVSLSHGDVMPDAQKEQNGNPWTRFPRQGRSQAWLLISILTIAAPLLVFGLIAQEVSEQEPLSFDQDIMPALRAVVDRPWFHEMARDITSLGSTIVLGITTAAVVGYLLLVHRRAAAWLMLGAVLGGVAQNNLLKFAFARPRPDFVTHAARVFSSSFPSGHATMSAITYLTIGALLARLHSSLTIRVYIISIAVLLILLIGMSRVVLGVHYPSDVLAGWCIGTAWAMGCWVLMTWLQQRGRVEPPIPS
jgi:undecaprenyl-diphosphatase